MTRPPNFDDLVGMDVAPSERDRLRRVHEQLLVAGPPPELSPEIALGPTLALSLHRPGGGRMKRRVLLLAATLFVLALAFIGGYLAADKGGGLASGTVLKLAGTSAAPNALASLRIAPVDEAGNWPMTLSATGLPKLPAHGYYTVWLMRDGKPYAPCGAFIVAGADRGVSVTMNAPYRLEHGDTWVVTKQFAGRRGVGPVVLQPSA